MKGYKYPVSKPSLKGNELKYVTDAIKSEWVSYQGSYVKRFEEEFAKYHKADYGVACNSGTNALVLALRALGIGKGDEVIVPEFTMVATAWAVSMTGATPVFVDCDDSFNIDVNAIEAVISTKTKAIIPVHVYGRVCEMDKILEIARDYNLYIIEDSCEALSIPIRGDIACFSLFANKIITAGEGGVAITNNERLAWQMKHLSAMGFDKDHSFLHKKQAYNFRMTNLQAAVALAQLEQVDAFLAKRKQIEKWYGEGLKSEDRIKILPERDVVWYYDIQIQWTSNEEVADYLKEKGIETRMFFKPMSMQPMYYNDNYEQLTAFIVSKQGLYLPTYTDLTEDDIDYIVQAINEFFETI